LRIYATATGKLLRTWSTNDAKVWGLPLHLCPRTQDQALSWADNDQTLALGEGPKQRLLNVTAPGET
jgi:hypothetical protein